MESIPIPIEFKVEDGMNQTTFLENFNFSFASVSDFAGFHVSEERRCPFYT